MWPSPGFFGPAMMRGFDQVLPSSVLRANAMCWSGCASAELCVHTAISEPSGPSKTRKCSLPVSLDARVGDLRHEDDVVGLGDAQLLRDARLEVGGRGDQMPIHRRLWRLGRRDGRQPNHHQSGNGRQVSHSQSSSIHKSQPRTRI